MTTPAKTSHRHARHGEALEILDRLLEIAGDNRRGAAIQAWKIRHRPAPFYAWDLTGRRTFGRTDPARWEYRLVRINPAGIAEGPKADQPAASWEQALLTWAEALYAAASPDRRRDLEESKTMIEAMVAAALAGPPPLGHKRHEAGVWLERLFSGTFRTEVPTAEIFQRAKARGISLVTLKAARKARGFQAHQRWQDGHSVHLWTKPEKDDQDGKGQPGKAEEDPA